MGQGDSWKETQGSLLCNVSAPRWTEADYVPRLPLLPAAGSKLAQGPGVAAPEHLAAC